MFGAKKLNSLNKSLIVAFLILLSALPAFGQGNYLADMDIGTNTWAPGDKFDYHTFVGGGIAPFIPTQKNVFRGMEEDARVNDNRSPGNTDGSSDGFASAYGASVYGLRYHDPNMWCKRWGLADEDGEQFTYDPEFCVQGARLTEGMSVAQVLDWIDTNKRLYKWRPTKKVMGHFNQMGPMSGFHDVLDWAVYGNVMSNSVANRLPVLMTTWTLTEPAVAGGLANAMKIGNQFLHSRYLAEQTFLQQANSNPETREMVLKAYRSCINKKMSSIKVDGLGDLAGLTNIQTWLRAQTECMHGERINDGIASMYQPALTNPGLTAGALEGGFELGDDPNHLKGTLGMLPGGDFLDDIFRGMNVTQEIRLTDYLFNQERWSTWTDAGLTDLGGLVGDLLVDFFRRGRIDPKVFNITTLGEMKKSFQEIYGDFKFSARPHCLIRDVTVNRDLGGDIGVIDVEWCPPQARTGSHEISIEKDEPKMGGNGYYRELTRRNYIKIHDILREICEFHNGRYWNNPFGIDAGIGDWAEINEDADSDNYNPLDYAKNDPSGAQDGNVFADGAIWKDMTVLSMRGFRMNEATIMALYSMFLDEQIETNLAGDFGVLIAPLVPIVIPTTSNLRCDNLNALPDQRSSIEFLMESVTQQAALNYCQPDIGPVIGRCLHTALLPRMRTAFLLAQKIALGQLLATFIKTEQELNRLIDSGADNFVAKYAKQLVYDQAGTDDLFKAYEENLEEAKRFIELLYSKQRQWMGSGADLFKLSFNEAKHMKEAMN